MTLNQKKLEAAFTSLITVKQRQQLNYYLFATIPSTNQILWELLASGINPPLVAIAAQQTAGRGQWGRTWQSSLGGLYLSLALSPQISAINAPHLTLFTAWGIADKLRSEQIPVLLKWPNDLVLAGKKLGGIKSETHINQGIITQAVIGVGINWTNPVPETGINLKTWFTDNSHLSLTCLERLAALTIAGILSGYGRYLNEGIQGILTSYLEILQSLGKSVIINGSSGVVTGVTSQGKLLVKLQSPGATTEVALAPGVISLGYE
jgi:BirA family biotin operon repressor/biotin-[acetyl-CoA-carboxylase] ligase